LAIGTDATAKIELKPVIRCLCFISSTTPLSAEATSLMFVSELKI
jgi:hypothetical protein